MFRCDELAVTRTVDGRRVLLVDLDAVEEELDFCGDEIDWSAIVECARTIRALDDALEAGDYVLADRLVWSLHAQWDVLAEAEAFMDAFARADTTVERQRLIV